MNLLSLVRLLALSLAVPGPPSTVRVELATGAALRVRWSPPLHFPHQFIQDYTLRHYTVSAATSATHLLLLSPSQPPLMLLSLPPSTTPVHFPSVSTHPFLPNHPSSTTHFPSTDNVRTSLYPNSSTLLCPSDYHLTTTCAGLAHHLPAFLSVPCAVIRC